MKGILCFLGGILVGSAATLLWMRKEFEQKVQDEVNDILAEKAKKEKDKEHENELEEAENDEKYASDMRIFGSSEEREAVLKGLTDQYGYTNYAGMSGAERVYSDDFDVKNGLKNEKNDAKNGENNVSLLKNKSGACATKSDTLDASNRFLDNFSPPEDGFADSPYGISDEEFYTKDGKFMKKTLIYYDEDDVFTDECATLCANVSLLVGEKWRIEIGKFEKNVAFIRNEKMGTDYEIIVENCAFRDTIRDELEEV